MFLLTDLLIVPLFSTMFSKLNLTISVYCQYQSVSCIGDFAQQRVKWPRSMRWNTTLWSILLQPPHTKPCPGCSAMPDIHSTGITWHQFKTRHVFHWAPFNNIPNNQHCPGKQTSGWTCHWQPRLLYQWSTCSNRLQLCVCFTFQPLSHTASTCFYLMEDNNEVKTWKFTNYFL